jgi:hypothetical protein
MGLTRPSGSCGLVRRELSRCEFVAVVGDLSLVMGRLIDGTLSDRG